MQTVYSDKIAEALSALEDTDALEDVVAGRVSLGDDESYLPFENGFDMAMAYVREAAKARYVDPPVIFAGDHGKEHARLFFFGRDEEEVLERIAAAARG